MRSGCNAGSKNAEEIYQELLDFTKRLNEEEHRGIAEQLTEEELAIFDLLTKPEIQMSDKERQKVKKVAKELLKKLQTEKFVLDWRKKLESRAAVRLTIEEELDQLPEVFDKTIYQDKCARVYQYVYEH